MANLSSFMPYVLPYVEACPDIVAEIAVVRASIEFCEKTKYWRHDLDDVTPVKNIKEYDLIIPDDSMISSIDEPIEHDGHEILLKTKHWISQNVANWKTVSSSRADYLYVPSTGKIRLVPYPDVTAVRKLSISVILKPIPTAATVPDFLFNDYFEAIADGAKAILYKIPNKPWTDLGLYEDSRAAFDKAMEDAESKSRAGFRTEDRRNKVKPHYF